MKRDIKSIKNFLFDMDGTIYLGEKLFPGTLPLLEKIRSSGRHAVFLTNNSSMSPEDYALKLSRLGIFAPPGDIFTSGDAAAQVLSGEFANAKIYLLGTPSLEKQLSRAGFEIVNSRAQIKPDVVLLGFDKTLTYEKIMHACEHISRGLHTRRTRTFSARWKNGFIPDTGSMIKMFEAATGVSPVVVGKPEKTMRMRL